MFLFLYESHLTVGLCMDNQMSLLSHRTSLEHIISQLRLQLRTLYVPPLIFVFRCYYNIQAPTDIFYNYIRSQA